MNNIFGETFSWLADPARWTGSSGILVRLLEHLQHSGLVLVIAAAIAVPAGLYIIAGLAIVVDLILAAAHRALLSPGLSTDSRGGRAATADLPAAATAPAAVQGGTP